MTLLRRQNDKGSRAQNWFSLVVLLIMLAVLWALFARMQTSAKLDKLIAAERASGLPVSLVELDVWLPRPSLAENAAPLYQQAFSKLRNPTPGESIFDSEVSEGLWKDPSMPLSPEMVEAMEAYLKHNTAYLDLIREAAQMPQCRFPVDMAVGTQATLPHLAPLQVAVHMLWLDVILAAQQGDSRRVVEGIRTMSAVGEALRNEPTPNSQGVRMQNAGSVCSTIERVLSQISLPETDLLELEEIVKTLDRPDAWYKSLVGQRCVSMASFDSLAFGRLPATRAGRGGRSSSAIFRVLSRWSGAFPQFYKTVGYHRDRLCFFEVMTQAIRAADLPVAERNAAMEQIQLTINELPDRYVYCTLLLEYFLRSYEASLAHLVKQRCALAACAIERFRLVTNRLPETLDELVPDYLDAVPTDPYVGAPLRYKRRDPGYVVYSVGRDGSDDGGEILTPSGKRSNRDVAFYVAR